MRNYIQTFLIIFTLLFTGSNDLLSQSKEEIKEKLIKAHTQNINSSGREYWVSFPLNERKDWNTQALGIFITSSVNTTVTFSNDYLGIEETRNVESFGITTFSSEGGNALLNFDWEIKDYERPLTVSFKLTSPDPISVYVMNSKQTTSEGYLAIPIKFWGTRYIHNSYYDFNEGWEWAGGFAIMANEDNTTVEINLRDGANDYAGFGETTGGREHGDKWQVTLQKGQVYAVQGTGETRGIFDLSGSIITSDKPIGLLSYHNRCMIPSQEVNNGRDYLIEMMPPTKAWGKEYATVELARGTGYGDYVRVVASEPNTTVEVKWWDKKSGEEIRTIPVFLKKAGDWWEYKDVPVSAPHDQRGVQGVSRYEADKPILVMQYSYSARWDDSDAYDPFMFLVTAKEQYTTNTVFQTPSNHSGNEFRDNYLNIIAIGDPDNPERHQKLLESVELDGERIIDLQPAFYGNRIPGTDLYWSFLDGLGQGRHEVTAETPFGGYIYGFANFDSYGWPAATAYKDLAITDTLPPIVTFPPACNEWVIHNVDDPEHERNGQEGDDPQQIDQGVAKFPELQPGSFNFYEPIYVDENGNDLGNDTWDPTPPNYDFYYKVGVIDPYQDGLAILRVEDEYGNVTDTTIEYNVDSLLLDPEEVHFGNIRVNTSENLEVELMSNSPDTISIESIELMFGDVYNAVPIENPPYELEPFGTRIIELTYTPNQEYPEVLPHEMDIDTLMVKTGCVNWKWPIDGRGVEPKIIAGDFNFETTLIDKPKTSEQAPTTHVRIENPGTDTLIITGVEFVEAPFSMPNANPTTGTITFSEPVIVPPLTGNVVRLEEGYRGEDEFLLEFAPKSANNDFGVSRITVNYLSNADGPDSESIWRGNAISSGMMLTPKDFPPTRVKDVSEIKYFVLENIPPENSETGELDPDLGFDANIPLQDDLLTFPTNSEFYVDWDDGIKAYNSNDNLLDTYTEGNSVIISPSGSEGANDVTRLLIPVRFNPSERTTQVDDDLLVTFNTEEKDEDQTIEANTIGSAYIPEIDISNVNFPGKVVRDEGPHSQTMTLELTNVTEVLDWDVTIQDIYLDPNAPNSDQFVLDPDPSTLDYPITLEKGSPLLFDVTFLGDNNAALGENIGRLIVESDAGDEEALPTTENRWGVESSGNYVYDAPDTVDGGMIRGEVSETGVEANGHNFGTVLACDIEPGSILIRNNATDDSETIESIEPVSGDTDAFEIQDVSGVILESEGGETTAEVLFVATEMGREFEAVYNVKFESGNEDSLLVRGEIYENTIVFSSPNYVFADNSDLKPGDITGDEGVEDFDIEVSQDDETKWDDSKITEVTFSVKYKTNWIDIHRVNNNDPESPPVHEFSPITNNWRLKSHQWNTETIDNDEWTILTMTVESPNPNEYISGNGNLIRLKFTYLLSDEISIDIPIEDITFADRGACHNAIETVTEIESEFCISNQRAIVIGTATEGPLAEPISPNPVKNGRINYEYLVPTTAHTTIKIENSEGKVVKVPYDGMAEHGIYESTINVSDLPSGTYFISLKHLGSEETQQFIIVK